MRMLTVETFEKLVGGGGNIGEGNPRVFIHRHALPTDKVFIALAELAGVEDSLDCGGG